MDTINISLPKTLHQDARKLLKSGRYASMSELMRDALRKILYSGQEITENGFTQDFEDRVLQSAAEPLENDTILVTPEEMRTHFNKLAQDASGFMLNDKDKHKS